MRKRRFLVGAPFFDAQDAAQTILAGEWVFFAHKPIHPGWSGNWSLAMIRSRWQHMRHAILNPQWKAKEQ